MAKYYDRQRLGKYIFLAFCGVAVIIFLLISNNLVKELAAQERERVSVWAQATERLAKADSEADFEFLLAIIQQNTTIPVLVADQDFQIIELRNFNLPDKEDIGKSSFEDLTDRNKEYLTKRLLRAAGTPDPAVGAAANPRFIKVEIYNDVAQYIYYEDSVLLHRLSLYPYVQLAVMIVLALIIYAAMVYSKKAEQDRVWVGLSKETAHQLGTPISSLMAWNQYLESCGTDKEIVEEMGKDVDRLSMIADRFSKIGSQPELELDYLNECVEKSLSYLRNRLSGKIEIVLNLCEPDNGVQISPPLFGWVMENIVKNAVDAMDGAGCIEVTTGTDKDKVYIEIHDTGKGIPRKHFKSVFNPGFTTKKRGWGLGLTLVKRIVEEYHKGRIFVKDSEPGRGTTFRIELPSKN